MKRKIAVAGAVLAGLISATPAVALADETPRPTDCAAAVVALNDANRAHQDALRADRNADEAEEADRALQLAENRLKDAQEAAAVARTTLDQRVAFLNGLDPNEVDAEDIADAEAAVAEAQTAVDEAEELVEDLTDARDDAADDAKSDALELRDVANKSNAAATKDALDDARADFNRLCGAGADDPTDDVEEDADPAPVKDKADDDKDMVVPSGGVDTGGGPA